MNSGNIESNHDTLTVNVSHLNAFSYAYHGFKAFTIVQLRNSQLQGHSWDSNHTIGGIPTMQSIVITASAIRSQVPLDNTLNIHASTPEKDNERDNGCIYI